jgi:MtN3 and saliva related transmembrane protein
MIEFIGYMAAILGTICFLPQAVHTWRTRNTQSLSLWANLLMMLNLVLWLSYGILLNAWPLIVANTIALAIVGSIITAKLIYK